MMRRPRVLVFSTLLPLPVDRGDRNRLFHTLQLLASVATVQLVAVERAWETPVHDVAPLGAIDVIRVPVTARAVAAAGGWAALTGRPYLVARYALPRVRRAVRDAVHAFAPDVFWGYQAPSFPFLAAAPRARRIVDLVDSPSRYAGLVTASREVPMSARLAMGVQWRLAASERQALSLMEAALVNSGADAAHVRALAPASTEVVMLDNCIPRDLMRVPWQPDASRPPTLLFVGNLAYVPNAAAVRLLLTAILPRVRRRFPEARAVICGARGDALALEFAGMAGVEFRGFVPDLLPLYRSGSVMLVPVPLAGGTQYKLLESMAVGLPAVVSGVSAAITGVAHGTHVLVGDSPDEYADAACRLLSDATLAAQLSAEARRFVEARHTWESKRPLIERLVQGHGPLRGRDGDSGAQ
jgi:polysaccharide biosynthesis protein PslH